MNDQQQWSVVVASGLSLVNFLAQNLTDEELQTVVGGWLVWSESNIPIGLDHATATATVMNEYTKSCVKEGGKRLAAQARVVKAFRAI